MVTLTGTLRQAGTVTFDGKTKVKIWLEHTTARETGVADLKLEELFLEGLELAALPASGSEVSFEVRPYAVGKLVKFQAVRYIAAAQAPKKAA